MFITCNMYVTFTYLTFVLELIDLTSLFLRMTIFLYKESSEVTESIISHLL
jgi:hypothetical protein